MQSNAFRLTPPDATPGRATLDALRDLLRATPLAIFLDALKSAPPRRAGSSVASG